MDNFDLKKYLAEGKLHENESMGGTQFTKKDVLRVLGYDIERSEDEEDEEMLSILRDYKQKFETAEDDHSTLEGILDDMDSALSSAFGDDFDIIGSYMSTIKNEAEK